MAEYFTSFYPLCCTSYGDNSYKKHGLPPYIDGSCRREPDFENKFPAITGLCRPGFSKKLKEKDIVVYTTNKKFIGVKKIVAILEVVRLADSHQEAASWYMEKGKTLPNNILVRGNLPKPLTHTHYMGPWKEDAWTNKKNSTWNKADDRLQKWDDAYQDRASDNPHVAICKVWGGYKELWEPVEMKEQDMLTVFNRIPVTRNPPAFKGKEWEKFLKWLRQ